MSDVVVNRVDVVEIVAAPHSVTEVVGLESTGLVQVTEIAADVTVIDHPAATGVIDVITAGPIGPQGPRGPEGASGPAGALVEQRFPDAAYVWVVHHTLNTYPVVTTVDLNEDEIVGDVRTPDRNTVVVTFAVPMSGTARLKA